ncbi:uncharacterized protein LOC141620117 [Silene latifolia]|uniref:uncharacterized protein LOC141620117 n=1 Tax=Silene latifolia TaxID=37657 RepID=UPI003D773C15
MKKPNLDNLERGRISDLLLEKTIDGKVKHGAMAEIAAQFGVCSKTITKIWNKVKVQHVSSRESMSTKRLKGRKMPKRKEFDTSKLESLELAKRTTQYEVSKGMGVSQSTVCRWVKADLLDSHTNATKPLLTDKNKLERLIYCLSHLQYDKNTKRFIFKDQSNVIHIDEKWFFITKPSQRFYVGKKERRPFRCVQSKRFITKVMFMCAVSRPKYGPNKEVICDGKIGIWPFVMEVPAKRKSKNRSASTLETKNIESITKQVTKEMLISNVLPAIKAKWPANYSKNILIQQDNARPHINNVDADFRKHANEDEWNIQFSYQPPNSPDLNVLDLGFFRAIQSLQQKEKSNTLQELLDNVMKAYEELEVIKLNYVFITLQACMLEIMQLKGGIDYPIPHMHKSKLASQSLLPEYLDANTELVKDCIRYVTNLGHGSRITELVESFSSGENSAENSVELTDVAGCSNDPTGEHEVVGNITEDSAVTNAVQVADIVEA